MNMGRENVNVILQWLERFDLKGDSIGMRAAKVRIIEQDYLVPLERYAAKCTGKAAVAANAEIARVEKRLKVIKENLAAEVKAKRGAEVKA